MNYKKFLGAASAVLIIVIAITLVLAPAAWAQGKYKTLYKFKDGNDGGRPDASMIVDQAGNLYSTTITGGSGYGTVFELIPNQDGSWRKSLVYSFTGGADGQGPMAGLVFDQSGNFYGTTYFGGDAGVGTVFELTPNADGSWKESVLHSFTDNDGSNPVSGVILDAKGGLYGTTTRGGAAGGGTVFKLTPNQDGSWTASVLHTFKGGRDGSYPTAHGSLVFDVAGLNLYGTTAAGGKGNCGLFGAGCGTIFELTPNSDGTWTEQVLHRFSGGTDGAIPCSTPIFDKSGNLYGTTMFGGAHGVGNVFELMPNADGSWKEKVLHQFKSGWSGPEAGVIFDQAGNLYGTTVGDQRPCSGQGCGVVFKLAPNSNGGWDETVLHTFMDHPGAYPSAGVIFDPAGNLYGTTYGDDSKTFGSVFEITP